MDKTNVTRTEIQWGVELDDLGSVDFYEEEEARAVSAMSSLPLVKITYEFFPPVEE